MNGRWTESDRRRGESFAPQSAACAATSGRRVGDLVNRARRCPSSRRPLLEWARAFLADCDIAGPTPRDRAQRGAMAPDKTAEDHRVHILKGADVSSGVRLGWVRRRPSVRPRRRCIRRARAVHISGPVPSARVGRLSFARGWRGPFPQRHDVRNNAGSKSLKHPRPRTLLAVARCLRRCRAKASRPRGCLRRMIW